jgi:hypothetical protein
MENEAHQIMVPNACPHDLGQVVEVHIAGVALVTHAHNTDLCFSQIGIGEANAV